MMITFYNNVNTREIPNITVNFQIQYTLIDSIQFKHKTINKKNRRIARAKGQLGYFTFLIASTYNVSENKSF